MELQTILIDGGALLGNLIASVAVAKWRIEQHEKDFEKYKTDHKAETEAFRTDVWREVGKLREWRHSHQEESGATRLEIEKKFGGVFVLIANIDGKFAPITEMMSEIIKRLDKIDNKIDRIETRDE